MAIKSYADFMNEISANELYEGLLGYGFFSEKLPPVFTAVPFFKYCVNNNPSFNQDWHDWISYSTMRNVNIPRQLGIPTPMKYQKLCIVLRDNWSKIQQHFEEQTKSDTFCVSRLHLRKHKSSKVLFEMNYKDWNVDGNPETELLLTDSGASRYLVKADISTCFPSIYSHAIPWALAGKTEAKKHIGEDDFWYNKIDKACRGMKNGETHGLLIGPHTSNLLSEIILTVVDKKLMGYNYYRNIDDYDCYVDSYEKAQLFLRDLEDVLREYDLPLNHKKTKILELPITITDSWIHKLGNQQLGTNYGKTTYSQVNNYLDIAINLTDETNNAAVLKWAIKALSGQMLKENAKALAGRRIMHLAVLNPYLLQLMDDYVFKPYGVDKDEIRTFTDAIFSEGERLHNNEAISYAFYYALRYDFKIKEVDYQRILDRGDCISMLLCYLYALKENHGYRNATVLKLFKNKAKSLIETDMDRYWLFCYEIQTKGNLHGEWKGLKEAGVGFIKPEFVARRK